MFCFVEHVRWADRIHGNGNICAHRWWRLSFIKAATFSSYERSAQTRAYASSSHARMLGPRLILLFLRRRPKLASCRSTLGRWTADARHASETWAFREISSSGHRVDGFELHRKRGRSSRVHCTRRTAGANTFGSIAADHDTKTATQTSWCVSMLFRAYSIARFLKLLVFRRMHIFHKVTPSSYFKVLLWTIRYDLIVVARTFDCIWIYRRTVVLI